MKVMIDLDGVLTNFNRQLGKLMDKTYPERGEVDITSSMWAKIAKAGKEYWSSMEWLPDGHKLWDEVKKYEPTILSAPSKHPSSIAGKKEWLKKELPGTPYIITAKKEKHADPESILIDDREKNINKWKKAGGIGILHKNAEDTIMELSKVLSEMKTASVTRILFKYAFVETRAFNDVMTALKDAKDPKATALFNLLDINSNFLLKSPSFSPEYKKLVEVIRKSAINTGNEEYVSLISKILPGSDSSSKWKERDYIPKQRTPGNQEERWKQFLKDNPVLGKTASNVVKNYLSQLI